MEYVNQSKYKRAQVWAKANGKEDDAEAIHDRYVSLGGLVNDKSEVTDELEPTKSAKGKKSKNEEE